MTDDEYKALNNHVALVNGLYDERRWITEQIERLNLDGGCVAVDRLGWNHSNVPLGRESVRAKAIEAVRQVLRSALEEVAAELAKIPPTPKS